MTLTWATRTEFVASPSAYSIVQPFGGGIANANAGATLALAVPSSVSPLVISFPTFAETYSACQEDMHLQLSLMRCRKSHDFSLFIPINEFSSTAAAVIGDV
ncbi:unnamed protein product [Durusdinium trenchii]|uniref:Uncharacterized protein n=1 Tax=Durusdinium trenchii TaxID=1381693 RepID=A0ABP0HT52_9DINO